MKRASRGQAIVETALGILVFVTVLMFGIHFTEVTFTQMKVTEAAQAGVWGSTAGEMHRLPRLGGTFAPAGSLVANSGMSAQQEYVDFDGRSASLNRSALPQQVFSTARAFSMRVQCQMNAGLRQSGATFLLAMVEAPVYEDNNGMTCRSEAWIDTGGISKIGTFLEGADGFFNKRGDASHKQSVTATNGYRVCGLNKSGSVNGACRDEFAMLIDDWGLASGQQEASACPVMPYGVPCLNLNFWTSAWLGYTANSAIHSTTSGADYRLLQGVVGTPFWPGGNLAASMIPANPTSFYMAFCGEDFGGGGLCSGLFTEFTPWHGDGSWWWWQTTPFAMWPTYAVAYFNSKRQQGCYLGQECNSTASSP